MIRHTIRDVGFAASTIWFVAEAPGPWTGQAACREYAAQAEFFTEASTFSEADLALMVCADCPVRTACLGYGQRLHADGVWGGQLLIRGLIQDRDRRRPPRALEDRRRPAAS
jgi:hypothetical protein